MDRAGPGAAVSLEQVIDAIARAARAGVLPRRAPLPRPDPAVRRAITQRVRAFAAAFDFRVELAGQHYSGLSNQELFDILGEQGREFAADTRQLRSHVRLALLEQFGDDARFVPGAHQLAQIAAVAVLEWVVARLEGRIHDERLRALTLAYARAKRRAGFGDKPIGQRTGALLGAVRAARVSITNEGERS